MTNSLLILSLVAACVLPARSSAQSATAQSAAARDSTATPSGTAPAIVHVEHGDKIRVTGVPNFGKINEHLYRGAQPRNDGLPELKKLGITTIVDLRGEDRSKINWEKKTSESLGMHFVNIPVSGWGPPAYKQIAQFLGIFRDNPNEKVFVHCRLGEDRTGVFVAAYRIAVDRFLSDEALHEMYFFGFNGFWHPAMRTFIRDFPNHLTTDLHFEPLKADVPKTGSAN